MKRTKSELIDELKNKISLSLNDPVLQQGFEIICKYDVRRFLDLPDLLLIHGVLLEKIKLQIQVINRLEPCKLRDLQESQLDQTREVLAKIENIICEFSPCAG